MGGSPLDLLGYRMTKCSVNMYTKILGSGGVPVGNCEGNEAPVVLAIHPGWLDVEYMF